MINLEPRQLKSGQYAQGVQLRVHSLRPVLDRLQELLLLPKAMRWIGDAAFELAALSRLQDGQVLLHRYLNLRLKVDPSAKEGLRQGVDLAVENLRTWLKAIGVHSETVVSDDQSLFSQMPDSGYTFIAKSSRRAGTTYEKIIMPVGLGCEIDLAGVRSALCRYPGCGISLQLMPDAWLKPELEQIQRFGRGSGLDESQWQVMMYNDIASFVCAAWGGASGQLADIIAGSSASAFARTVSPRDERDLAETLACDPWSMRSRLAGRSRFGCILSVQELKNLFHCEEPEINLTPLNGAQNACSDEIAEELRRLVDQRTRQTEESLREAISEAENRMETVVGRSEQTLRNEMKENIRQSREEILQDVRKHTAALSGMMEGVASDMKELQASRHKLQELLETQMLLTNMQLRELVQAMEGLTGERDGLRRELLNHTVQGAERPLSEKHLRLMGVADEAELFNNGMTDKQMAILRIAMACLDNKPVLEGGRVDSDDTDYHVYTLYLGFLYEQLMRANYHEHLYQPYFQSCMPVDVEPGTVENTELYCYDRGPEKLRGYRYQDWNTNTMAQNFADYVTVSGQKKNYDYWTAMLNRMRIARQTRNTMHKQSMDTQRAYNYVNLMIKSSAAYPCLIRMILNAGQAEAAFPNSIDENRR